MVTGRGSILAAVRYDRLSIQPVVGNSTPAKLPQSEAIDRKCQEWAADIPKGLGLL